MTKPTGKDDLANPFVAALRAQLNEEGIAAMGRPTTSGKVRRLRGFIDVLATDGTRDLYFTQALDRGVRVRQSDIVFRATSQDVDGLVCDHVWVTPDADLLFWSRRPMVDTDPVGGNGYGDPIPGG